jgi:hypothetical protein
MISRRAAHHAHPQHNDIELAARDKNLTPVMLSSAGKYSDQWM